VSEFAGQDTHAVLPVVDLNFPASQAEQEDVSDVISPVYPTPQRHAVTAAAPVDPLVFELTGQVRQVPISDVRYVSSEHARHDVSPSDASSPACLKNPALHAVQV